MYLDHYGLTRMPFSIAPDPELLFLGAAHSDALAHLNYSLTAHGGLICLTGEVGLGKTTLCRAFISSLSDEVKVAYIFNPQLSANELLSTICQELAIEVSNPQSLKALTDDLYHGLLDYYQQGKKVLCIIDEAQTMPEPLLEQIRLLTNLETDKEKLMTLILVGQPELKAILQKHSLRQLNQRITARFHLPELSLIDTQAYVKHRLKVAGTEQLIFTQKALEKLWQLTSGVPRLINAIADRALLGGYAQSQQQVDEQIVAIAAAEVLGEEASIPEALNQELLVKPGMKPIENQAVISNAVNWAYPLTIVVLLSALLYVVFNSQQINLNHELLPQQAKHAQPAKNSRSSLGSIVLPETQLLQHMGLAANNCQQLLVTDWRCLKVDWSFEVLAQLNQWTLVLTQHNDWQLLNQVSSEQYAGRAIVIWQPVAGYIKPISPLQKSPLVAWLRSQFTQDDLSSWKVIGSASSQQTLENFYDPLLAERVAEFQRQNGLRADKIIGPQTLMMLQVMQDIKSIVPSQAEVQ